MIVDLDLLILASSHERYEQYCRDIRFEYKKFSDKEWALGRIAFLQAMLKRPRLFYDDVINLNADSVARNNMSSEIKKLTNIDKKHKDHR